MVATETRPEPTSSRQNPSIEQGGVDRSCHKHLKSYWHLRAVGERESQVWLLEDWVLTRPGPTPKTNWAAETRLSGGRKNKEEEKEKEEGEEEERWGGSHGGGRRNLKSNGAGREGEELFNDRLGLKDWQGNELCSKCIGGALVV